MNSGLTGSLATAPLRSNSFRRINKQAKFYDQLTWSSNLGSLTHISSPTDQPLRIVASDPVQANTAVAGNNLVITASNATVGRLTAGAAAGGSINITAGNSAALSSGTASGGSVNITGGDANTTAWPAGGNGGGISLVGGTCGKSSNAVGGSIVITAGNIGVSATGGASTGTITIATPAVGSANYLIGDIQITGGDRTSVNTAGQPGGAVKINTGSGSSIYVAGTASNGGVQTITLGAGGSNSSSSGSCIGGNGGAWSIVGGTGGAVTGTTATHTGGNGSAISITSGTGGAATSASGTRTGGNGGAITLTTGNGGAGSTTNGNSGSFTISTGTAGAGAGSAGTVGSIIFRPGGTTQLTVDSTGVILANATAYAVLCGGTSLTTPLQSVASVGTAGQVLTSNGAGALPTFQTPSSIFTSPVIFPAFTIAAGPSQIPSAASWPYGRCFVTDSNQTLTVGIGTNVAGGGTDKVPVWSDGSNWIIG